MPFKAADDEDAVAGDDGAGAGEGDVPELLDTF